MASKKMKEKILLLYNGKKNASFLEFLPSIPGKEFVIADSESENVESIFKSVENDSNCMIVAPPVDVNFLDSMWEKYLNKDIKWIHSFSAGVDHLDTFSKNRLLERDDVTLTNGRGAFSSSLAEYIMAASLLFNKQIVRCQKNRKEAKWERFTMNTLKGKTMGFVGFGDIAQNASRIAKDGFGMEIAVLRRDPSKLQSGQADIVCTDKKALFGMSDFVVCTLPGTSQTKNFCSKEEFDSMKQDSVFISCGRGSAVDEAALYDALKRKQIYAALDVFAQEPLPTDSKLWEIEDERIWITCHNADLTDDYVQLGWNVFLKNMKKYESGQGFETVVDKLNGY